MPTTPARSLLSRTIATAGGLLPILLMLWLGGYAFAPGPGDPGRNTPLVIPPDMYYPAIENKLVEQGIIIHDPRFKLLAHLMGVANSIKAGEYIFAGAESPHQVLRDLRKGSMVQRPVTVREGANLAEIAEILGTGGWLNPDRFLELTRDPEFIQELGLKVDSLEGYLFPDTYFFERGGQNAASIIRAMVAQMQKVLSETGADQGKPESGLDVHKVLTLASIVEKETALALERPLIARVFLNRLNKRMKLQTDPTVIYGIKDFDGNLTRRHLREHTPYNTYVIRGLPPGPIGSPGREAIRAVMEPANGTYYYFVSKNNGSHYFSRSLTEHNRAVNKYQKRRRRRK